MFEWKNGIVHPSTTIREALLAIDRSGVQIALVVDENNLLLGTLTDGDIRRGILQKISLEDHVTTVMNRKPLIGLVGETNQEIIKKLRQRNLRQIPIVDRDGRLADLQTIEALLLPHSRDNWVVIMAGGQGMRMRPLTETRPKPLLEVGKKPLVETIISNFMDYGFKRFYISVNYMADMVKDHLGDGTRFGAEIRYLQESTPLGTAGALSLLPEKPQAPMIVMNCDVLTKINFVQLLDFHAQHKAAATMCVKEYEFQVPYGVVRTEDHRILSIDEKPQHRFFINGGIYVLSPSVMGFIASDKHLDMPNLFKQLKEKSHETAAFPITEYWLDIGQKADFERAQNDYTKIFG